MVRVRDGDAVTGPLEQLDVVLAVSERDRGLAGEAQPLGHERETGRLRHLPGRELEEVGKRLRDVEPPSNRAFMTTSSASMSVGSPTVTSFVGGSVSHAREIADDVDGEILEAA